MPLYFSQSPKPLQNSKTPLLYSQSPPCSRCPLTSVIHFLAPPERLLIAAVSPHLSLISSTTTTTINVFSIPAPPPHLLHLHPTPTQPKHHRIPLHRPLQRTQPTYPRRQIQIILRQRPLPYKNRHLRVHRPPPRLRQEISMDQRDTRAPEALHSRYLQRRLHRSTHFPLREIGHVRTGTQGVR